MPLEQLKGRDDIRKPNPNFPQNFFTELDKELKTKNIVLIPISTTIINNLNLLTVNTRIILAIKEKDCFNDLIQIYKERKNDINFIKKGKPILKNFMR